MSDTAAFLAGCAVTGVAVLFVMRNDFANSQTRVPPSLQTPPVVSEIPNTPTPSPSSNSSQDDGRNYRLETEVDQQRNLSRDLSDQLRRQQDRTEDLRTQLERQQQQTEDLKSKLDKQERNTELLILQIQEQQRLLERLSDQPVPTHLPMIETTDKSNSVDVPALITGAVGVVVVVIVAGGGLILFAIIVIVLLSSRRRSPRTVHIVHPFPSPYPSLQPQSLLPARSRGRSPRHIDVEYYDDSHYD